MIPNDFRKFIQILKNFSIK